MSGVSATLQRSQSWSPQGGRPPRELRQRAPVVKGANHKPKYLNNDQISPWMSRSRTSMSQLERKAEHAEKQRKARRDRRSTIPKELLSSKIDNGTEDATADYLSTRSTPPPRFPAARLPLRVVSVEVATPAEGKPSRGCRVCRTSDPSEVIRYAAVLDLGRGVQEKFTHRFSDWLKA